MGFVSYNRVYYQAKLDEYESKYGGGAPKAAVHEAKVLLKVLEDIHDEGYTFAYNSFSAEFDCINRLKAFITKNGETPFEVASFSLLHKPDYSEETTDLREYLNELEERMRCGGRVMPEIPELFYDISDYTKSIFSGAGADTAYIFLLRDALLPYLAFRKWDAANRLALYPILVGRRYLSFFQDTSRSGSVKTVDPTGESDELYDALHECIFSALLKEPDNFNKLRAYLRELLLNELHKYPLFLASVSNLLSCIPQKKILVVESGYIGTIPMLLCCLDDRVDFRLFTTIPCFYKVYRGKYFTDAFERIRLFETVQCQDALFKLSSIDGGRFHISETVNGEIKEYASMELRTWNSLV